LIRWWVRLSLEASLPPPPLDSKVVETEEIVEEAAILVVESVEGLRVVGVRN
jgi:hypothetical protein